MSAPIRQRGLLLALAAEGLAPAVPGCAQAFRDGERVLERFGILIVARWRAWLPTQHRARQLAALEQLAGLTVALTRDEATAAIERMTPTASPEDRTQAIEYLCALPRTAQRHLVPDPHSGGLTLPSFQSIDDDNVLLGLLPGTVPPFPQLQVLPDSAYTLGEIVRADATGVTYRATATETGERVAVQFFVTAQGLDRARLDQLVTLGNGAWPERLVRLIDYNLERHPSYLILDTIPGADLTTLLVHLRHQTGRGPAADEVLVLMKQLAAALASLHALGLVHGALAPVHVLIGGDALKLADLAMPTQAVPAEDVDQFGLLWYRLLLGDWSAALPHDWSVRLERDHSIPDDQLALLKRCLGDPTRRPADGQELLAALEPRPLEQPRTAFAEVSPEEVRATRLRREQLLRSLQQLRDNWLDWDEEDRRTQPFNLRLFLGTALFAVLGALTLVIVWGFTLVRLLVALPIALLFALASERGLHWRRRTQVHRRLEALHAETARLADTYPDEVDAWGGVQVLRNVEMVREFIQALQLDVGESA